jgi:xanthine phosphoribosyltransferase
MKKIYYTWSDVEGMTLDIIRQISNDGWRPDYVVGLTRGGLTPANLISQYLEVPMETLKVSLRDDDKGPESNFWMAEDAHGDYFDKANPKKFIKRNILIVDDINDSGATLNWIKQDWQSSKTNIDSYWDQIWNENVRFAVLVNNEASEYKRIDYSAINIDKSKEPSWIVFPWEDWWQK